MVCEEHHIIYTYVTHGESWYLKLTIPKLNCDPINKTTVETVHSNHFADLVNFLFPDNVRSVEL